MPDDLTHLNQRGEVHMVEVGDRPTTRREAHASGAIRMNATTLAMIQRGETPRVTCWRWHAWPPSKPPNAPGN